MNEQGLAIDPESRPGAAYRRTGFRGIAGKIVAVVAGLLTVFLLAGAALVYQTIDLGRPNDFREALVTSRQDSELVLIKAREKIGALRGVFLAGTDTSLRAKRLQSYEAADEVSHGLLERMVARAATPQIARRFETFQTSHRQADAVYDRTLDAFLASGGKNSVAADAATQDLEAKALAALEAVSLGLEDQINAEARRQVTKVNTRITYIVVVGLIVLLALSVVALVVVRRVVRPIVELTRAADDVATRALPAAVARVKALEEGDAAPELDAIVVDSRDETSQLARALHSLQTSALTLAVEQRQAERDSAEMLVNLGRRNQNLLNRTLAYITELERSEQDPEVLDRLFRLDHATTRIRRNAESMLVLAGANQTRTWSVPAPVGDVIRAALSEIEDYNRVDLYHVQDTGIGGSVISDVVHLLAELMENAANFSPPSTKVTVVGQTVSDGYRIRIIDEGIGMTRNELDAANRSIQAASGGHGASKLLGLYVVGRLAARRGIEVVLEASGGRGVTASVVLPRALLAELPAAQPAAQPAAVPQIEAGRDPSGHAVRRLDQQRYARTAAAPARPSVVASGSGLAVPAPAVPAPAAPAVAHVAPEAGQVLAEPSPGIVRRVRGAQLPDLGPGLGSAPDLASPDAVDVRGRLSALQAGVRAGRQGGVPEPATEQALAEVIEIVPELTDHAEAVDDTVPAAQVVPIRVRGAQLPDLGLIEEPPDTYLAPSPEANRWKLRSFQLDVEAARRDAGERSVTEGNGRPVSTSEES